MATPKEVYYARVLKNQTYEMCNDDDIGYYFDTSNIDIKRYPHLIIKYFMACYGPAHTSVNTAEWVRKIVSYEVMSASQILNSGNTDMITRFNQQIAIFPADAICEHIHVLELGERIPTRNNKLTFTGGNRGYFDLIDVI